MADAHTPLGANLRDMRERRKLSLREVARRSEINSGYLSQLERGEVAQPTPSMLKRLADGYEVSLATLMGWAGYATAEPPMTPQLAKAMNYIGSSPSDDEVEAIRAVLKVLRAKSTTFSAPNPLDRPLAAEERELIRAYALALLRHADAVGRFPTPLDELMGVSKLVYAGEITLTMEARRGLMRRLGSAVVQRVLRSLEGLFTFGSNEIWLAEDMHPKRRRFVHAHEIGHHILPVHRELAYLDNWETMDSQLRDACEREANQAAIELLAQGDRLREIADDSLFGSQTVSSLAQAADISLQATGRRLAEDSKRMCATIIYYKSGQRLMSPHIYSSQSFEERFRWRRGRLPAKELSVTMRTAALSLTSRELICCDVKDRKVSLRCEAINTPKALIGLVAKDPGGPLAKTFAVRKAVELRSTTSAAAKSDR